jgi:tRNA uridine 5-carbamoylmethylation protein Kti12
MSFKILVSGYPGTGKTSLSRNLQNKLSKLDYTTEYFNEDIIYRENYLWVKSYEEEIQTWHQLVQKSKADIIIVDTIRFDFISNIVQANYIVLLNYLTDLTTNILSKEYHGTISVPKNYNWSVNNLNELKAADQLILNDIIKNYEIKT